MDHFTGGYYLMLPNQHHGPATDYKLLTCSTCYNDSVLGTWAIPWVKPDSLQLQEVVRKLKITQELIKEIQDWVGNKIEQQRIGWPEVFLDLATVEEFSDKYFAHLPDREILQIVFPAVERAAFMKAFAPTTKSDGALGIYDVLSREEIEVPDENWVTVGYDLIGVEISGDFHTFHCHKLAEEFKRLYNLELNEFGLMKELYNRNDLVAFMKDESNGFEPVPWFAVKVKRKVKVEH